MRILLALLAVLVLTAPAPAAAQAKTHRAIADTIFTELERRAVRAYFNERRAVVRDDEDQSRGKGKGGLPPGLATHLDRDGRPPPGLEKRELPPELARRLPPPRPGTKRVIVDDHVVLVEAATNVLLDVIEDAARGAVK